MRRAVKADPLREAQESRLEKRDLKRACETPVLQGSGRQASFVVVQDRRRSGLHAVADVGAVLSLQKEPISALCHCPAERTGQKTGHERFNQRGIEAQRLNARVRKPFIRSEEHTSELQSHHDLVCRLLLEKKNKK